MQPNGLSVEEVMNSVMAWSDHDKGQKADIKDNLDHYEVLLDELAKELPQVKKAGKNFVFTPEGGGVDVKDLFQKARSHAENSEVKQRDAWQQLLGLDGWEIKASAFDDGPGSGHRIIFSGVAPAEQKDVEVDGTVGPSRGGSTMRDLLDMAGKGREHAGDQYRRHRPRLRIFISNRPCGDKVTDLAKKVGDPRTLFLDASPRSTPRRRTGCSISPPTES